MKTLFDKNQDEDPAQKKTHPTMMVTRAPAPGPTETSRVAARLIHPLTSMLRRRVYDLIAEHGKFGICDADARELLGMKTNVYTPRRRELVQAELVEWTGENHFPTVIRGRQRVRYWRVRS